MNISAKSVAFLSFIPVTYFCLICVSVVLFRIDICHPQIGQKKLSQQKQYGRNQNKIPDLLIPVLLLGCAAIILRKCSRSRRNPAGRHLFCIAMSQIRFSGRRVRGDNGA
jgi:hypothetical protein